MNFKEIKKFEKLLFGLLLLLLSVNSAKHFIFDFCYVDGILVDYLIPTVYLTDMLVWGLLGLWLFRVFQNLSLGLNDLRIANSLAVRTAKLFLLIFVLVSGLSVFQSLNQPVAVYRWLKLVEYVLFAFYISEHVDLRKDWSTIIKLLSIGVLFESVLAVAQWLKQGSIFGYWFLGENKYTASTLGIATFDFFGTKKVRPYGTFPHPNVLGGYLSIVLPWVFCTGLKGIKGIKGGKGLKERFTINDLRLTAFVLGLIALFLSFSRSAWVVGALGLLASFPSSILNSSFILLNSLSFIRRAELNWIALEMVKDHPLLGVGLNNFTVAMSGYGEVSGWIRFLQPVHNVYLLIAAEVGLVGLVLFFCLLFSVFSFLLKERSYLLLISMLQIILLCFVDHYFWTLPQTSLLFWLLVGLAFTVRDNV